MSIIHPHGWRELLHGASLEPAPAGSLNGRSKLPQNRIRELETLALLADALDHRHSIYHGIHWTRLDGDSAVFDDIDFIVVGPSGKLLLIEQAAGFLEERPQGLTRKQAGQEIELAAHLTKSRAIFEGRLRRALGAGAVPEVDVLFYCPDYTVRDGGSAGLPPERIVDATRRAALATVVAQLLTADETPAPPVEKLHRFLSDLLGLVPDANAIVGEAAKMTTRLSGGLTEWARRLDFSPFRLRITGTAGSGKTQLALAVVRDALAAGRRPLYVCYNRPLADHVQATLPELAASNSDAGMVVTFHQLADRIARRRGLTPDFNQADVFQVLESGLAAFIPDDDWMFDELIVDEGQDFQPRWAEALLRLLRPEGKAWWLEDPKQNLYGRERVALPGWVELKSDTNYRSPRKITDAFATLIGQVEHCGSPIEGALVETLVYEDEAGLIEQTKKAIGQGIAAGFRREMIAVLSCHGRERSRLAHLDRLGPYSLQTFSGRYDLLGAPIYNDGDIVFDTVMRFKGRAAPCVILTEIDFKTLDETALRRLFVGATRAMLCLILVVSRRTAEQINLHAKTPPKVNSFCRSDPSL